MKARSFLHRAEGTAAVEFAITSPVYFLALFGLAQAALWLWSDFTLQRAVDAASRWAAVQYQLTKTCPNIADTQTYAVSATVGLPIAASAFGVYCGACGTNSSKVAATYSVPTFIPALPNIKVNVSACYPT
jgi:Flp pilus assembly protein TadG